MELQASVLLFPSTRLLPFWPSLSSPVNALLCQSRKACSSSVYSFLLVSSIKWYLVSASVSSECAESHTKWTPIAVPWSAPPTFAFYAPAEFLWFGLKLTLGDDSPPFYRRNVLSLSELPARVNKSKESLLKPGRIDAELALAKWCERPLG